MEDSTIFKPSSQNPQEPQSHSAQTVDRNQSVPPSQPSSITPSGNSPVPSSPPPSQLYAEPFPWGTILKIAGAVIFLVVLVFLIITFVIPRFQAQKKGNVTLIYWGLWEDDRVMAPIITEFEKQNPTITIQYIKQDPKQYRERIIARMQTGLAPDIFRFHNTWIPEISNILLPLSEDVISKTDFEKEYYPVMQKDLTKNGAIYGIPLGIDTLSLFVNTDILASTGSSIPTTWDDFLKTAKQVTVPDSSGSGTIKTAGAALGTFDNITHASDIVSLLLLQNGADLKNLSGTSENASDAFTFYVTRFAEPPDNVWDSSLDPSLLAFAKGNLAMYFGYSWDIFAIKAIDPNLKFKIADVPHLKGRNFTVASYWVEGVSSKTKHPKEAFLFMNFLTKKETLTKLYAEESKTRLFGELYPQVGMADLLKQNELVYPFVRQANTAVSSFFASDTYDNGLNEKANEYLKKAVESVLGNTSPQTAIDTLSQGVMRVLKQYGQ